MSVPADPKVLSGKTVVVTGAGRGIGRAIALAVARSGATVVLASRTLEQLEEVVREVASLGGTALAVTTDVTSRADVERLVSRAVEETGRIDAVVSNAGVFVWKPLEKLSEEEWDRVLATNLKATYLLVHAALPELKKSRGPHPERLLRPRHRRRRERRRALCRQVRARRPDEGPRARAAPPRHLGERPLPRLDRQPDPQPRGGPAREAARGEARRLRRRRRRPLPPFARRRDRHRGGPRRLGRDPGRGEGVKNPLSSLSRSSGRVKSGHR